MDNGQENGNYQVGFRVSGPWAVEDEGERGLPTGGDT